ncbi:ABC transporter ATP-binding protein [Campylobacter sp. faydin G-24]|uniref:ABC transporter ATP-binding protein n=1 Tax=Campylobacter anatolicus TaxID=2829105 RepID=A0ABS5HKG4_9BACT|nr:ABC transporter ATP-binding protein [Campylobacter anatolicus]MBR8461283.1 ABC transporter ATP-binding protein [Campylobacter anatolicus]MBR8464642.1 ABC transporter ATP-binding protein [Campylobacter anatolicus]
MSEILSVKNLIITDKISQKILINNISFALKECSTLGIVGESGSGKTMICKAIMGLCEENLNISGKIEFNGENLLSLNQITLNKIRGKKISLITQNALTALDPLYTIKDQFYESLNLKDKKVALKLTLFWLDKMGLNATKTAAAYPHELSGGQLQRAIIALALAQDPDIIIADEPTSALDTINAKEILNIFKFIKNDCKKSLIFVSHDLGAVAFLSDEILLMQHSNLVEFGTKDKFFSSPKSQSAKNLINTHKELFSRFNQCFA